LDFTSCEFVCAAAHSPIQPQRRRPKYLTEYNAFANVPSRFTGYTAPQSLREDPLWGEMHPILVDFREKCACIDRLAALVAALDERGPARSHGRSKGRPSTDGLWTAPTAPL
jgi:hypothetical protein